MNLQHDVRTVARQFQIYGEFLGAESYGSGHINDTYCAVFDLAGTRVRYILQRINHNIFKNPIALMENVHRVTAHLGAKLAGEPDFLRRALTLLPSREGKPWVIDTEGNCWRTIVYNKQFDPFIVGFSLFTICHSPFTTSPIPLTSHPCN